MPKSAGLCNRPVGGARTPLCRDTIDKACGTAGTTGPVHAFRCSAPFMFKLLMVYTAAHAIHLA
jgi:hypothetical protein